MQVYGAESLANSVKQETCGYKILLLIAAIVVGCLSTAISGTNYYYDKNVNTMQDYFTDACESRTFSAVTFECSDLDDYVIYDLWWATADEYKDEKKAQDLGDQL